MRKSSWWLLALLCFVVPARADEPQGKLTREAWDAAYLGTTKIGYLHMAVRSLERDGKTFYRTSQELRLKLKRYQQVGEIRMVSGTLEDADGKVSAVFMTQYLQGKELKVTGEVEEDGLRITDNAGLNKLVPWNDAAIGMYRQERLFHDRKVKPGDELTYHSYEPTISSSVTIHATVKDEEETEVLRVDKATGKVGRAKEKLLRVVAKPDEVKIGEQSLKLPSMVLWLDKERMPVRSELDMQPLGKIVFYRTTRAVAEPENGAAIAQAQDIGLSSMIRLNKAIDRPHDKSVIVYRITMKDDDKPESAVAHDDGRQTVENAKGQSFELRVQAVRAPKADSSDAKVKDDYRQANYFIDSDNARVKELAADAVGSESDPWKKARAIERWVHQHMNPSSSVAFCTASEAAKELSGDCRQHAMLTAALCRAAGVPSRTALGLIYVQSRARGPEMGFHMWTEVWINGQWLGIDATLGRGSVGAAHIKISDHSWHDTRSLTPMLPVARVLGKLAIEVVSAE